MEQPPTPAPPTRPPAAPTPGPAAIGRDPDAFETFYREHVRAVERFIARRVTDPQVAADLTDAAAALGVKPGTARVRLHRARRRLAATLAPARSTPRTLHPHPLPEEALS